jgi:hypothetical protein
MGKVYRRTQVGYLMIFVIGTGLYLLLNFFYLHGFSIFFVAVFVLLVLCLILFTVLTVTVDGQNISVRFGIGIIGKKLPLGEIESAEIVRNPWYYGWGIRKTPDGWLYNVSGFLAVELRMKNGQKYRIGTNDPAGLKSALEGAMGRNR